MKKSLTKLLKFLTLGLAALFFSFAGFTWAVSGSIPPFTSSESFIELVNQIAGFIATLVIPIAVICIIWSGIMFMAAEGNEEKITKAKKAITWSVIGLAIALIGKGFTSLIEDIVGPSPVTAESVINAFGKVADFMIYISIPLAVIFLTWAGFTYMFAGGDEQKIATAKKRLIWGIVGAAIVIGVGSIIRTMVSYFG